MGNLIQKDAVPSSGIGFDSLSASASTEENAIKSERKPQDKNDDAPNFRTDFVSPTVSPTIEEYSSTAISKVQEKEDDVPNLGLGLDSPIPPPLPPLEENSTTAEKTLQEKNDNVLNSGLKFDSPTASPLPEEEHLFTSDGLKFMLPGEVANILYPHQRDGLKWLWSVHSKGKGGILADDMGLGKTMQICVFLAGLFHSNMIRRVMVVAPKTLMPHWIKELTAVGLSGKIREYYGTSMKARDYELRHILDVLGAITYNADKGVLLTTYDIARNDVKSLCGDYYRCGDQSEEEVMWDYMILDEGHMIKNPSTQRAKSLHEIPSAHRIIISGTPLQNNLKELWALFNFCCPGLLGDKKWFKEKYEHFILCGNEKNASNRKKRISSQVAKELRECIQPYFLRRLKSDVFINDTSTGIKLSKKNEMCVWLKLTSCQRQLYVAFLKSEIVLSACDSSPLAALTILKKICDHPLLLTKKAAEEVLEGMELISLPSREDQAMAERLATQLAKAAKKLDLEDNHNISCKINFIMQLLEFLIPNGHHVLIFSQTRKMLDLIQASLMSVDLKFLRIDGTTKSADRLKIVNNFQEGHGAPIFLLTSQVGGLGLTLTKADRVIVVDPAWNPSTDNQSVDRAYRIGQKKDVVVYRLMTCGTVEEKIYRKQVFKGGLFKTATEHKEQIRYFSRRDLQELFSIPKQGFDVSLTQQQLYEEHDHHHEVIGSLKAEMEFLGAMDIGGVSQHSLLFSKTAPLPVDQDDEDVSRRNLHRARRWQRFFIPFSERHAQGTQSIHNWRNKCAWRSPIVEPEAHLLPYLASLFRSKLKISKLK